MYKGKITDGHLHIYTDRCIPYFSHYMEKQNFEAIDVACLCNLDKSMEHDGAQNILAAIMKLLYPGKVYAHGGLVYPEFPIKEAPCGDYDFENQAKELIDMGFDGIKMLENKPTTRKLIDIPTCSPVFDGFYSYLEKNQIPIVSHTADPETFWDYDLAPAFSHTEGWFYGDGTFLTKEAIYDEVDRTLQKFPNLKITLPHFYFLSDFPEKAREFLNSHPNITFDITPGREMYDNFTRHYEQSRELFFDFADRILFGTDMTSTAFQGEPSDMIDTIVRFLSTDDEFEYWDFKIKGINLPDDKVEKICYSNHRNIYKEPKPINKKMLAVYIERLVDYIKDDKTRKFVIDFAENNL